MQSPRTADFDYELPERLIAAHPPERRDDARLMCLDAATGRIDHSTIRALPERLRAGDLLVVNDSRVIPARLLGRRVPGGGRTEALLIRPAAPAPSAFGAGGSGVSPEIPASGPSKPFNEQEILPLPPGWRACRWEALVRPGKRVRPGDRIVFAPDRFEAVVVGYAGEGGARLLEMRWRADESWRDALEAVGKTPLPPYILRRRQCADLTYPWDDGLTTPADRDRYQTVYARADGSVAAPTAGLHFTPELLDALAARGVERAAVTLHVGPGTFVPVETDDPAAHPMHEEEFEVSEEAAAAINRALAEGRRAVAVGTTVVRVLEHLARAGGAECAAPTSPAGPARPTLPTAQGRIAPGRSSTRLLILPGFEFRVVGALVTNFHLPRSTLLMLVSAFAGREHILAAYREAIAREYRFYSYGDAMLIERP